MARLAGGDDQMNAVCPVWEGVTILRDELSEAAKGWVVDNGRGALQLQDPSRRWLPAAPLQARVNVVVLVSFGVCLTDRTLWEQGIPGVLTRSGIPLLCGVLNGGH